MRASSTDPGLGPGPRILRWAAAEGQGLDHCAVGCGPRGLTLDGMAIGERGGAFAVRYVVRADARGRTREVRVRYAGGAGLHLGADGAGGWTDLATGQPLPGLDGCLDVDIAATPATNALPVRRLWRGFRAQSPPEPGALEALGAAEAVTAGPTRAWQTSAEPEATPETRAAEAAGALRVPVGVRALDQTPSGLPVPGESQPRAAFRQPNETRTPEQPRAPCQSQTIRVVYIPRPEALTDPLLPRAAEQRYTPLGPRLLRYEALVSGFAATLAVDGDGFVIDYPGLFRRLPVPR